MATPVADSDVTVAVPQPPEMHQPTGQSQSTPSSGIQVIRRNGKVTNFDPSKISVAMTKAFLA
ncbi:MAG: hypothetical protein N0E37_11495, partial [Candidatus Thiodiazotropha taylori]|nr:hypothetical protein [Candidatus Thiodiazotropha taylori]MCW4245051.1 hypothetical protein [Candidatus Thiodiazotropha taylori]